MLSEWTRLDGKMTSDTGMHDSRKNNTHTHTHTPSLALTVKANNWKEQRAKRIREPRKARGPCRTKRRGEKPRRSQGMQAHFSWAKIKGAELQGSAPEMQKGPEPRTAKARS